MQNSDNVIQLAKERALFGFAALLQQSLFDAEARIDQLFGETRSGTEQYALVAGRQFLQTAGAAFVKRVEAEYRGLLDRAMETMYKEWRVSISQISTANLTLVDDDTVKTQIEVDRLVLRLRDADDANLRKLNLIVAQMHGKYDVNERENPFRPYLMARSVHNILRQMLPEEEVNQKVFALLSDALSARLTDFYAALREVFESNGMHAQLMAQRNRHARSRRDFDGESAEHAYAAEVNARVMPGLQRMRESMGGPSHAPQGGAANPAAAGQGSWQGGGQGAGQPRVAPGSQQGWEQVPDIGAIDGGIQGAHHHGTQQGAGSGAQHGTGQGAMPGSRQDGPGSAPAGHGFQDFVEGFFKPPTEVKGWPVIHQDMQALGLQPMDGQEAERPGSPELLTRLDQYQHRAARGQGIDEQSASQQNQLFALGEQLRAEQVSQLERAAIDVVGMLFELILSDKHMPIELRNQIGRLQIPFLKAALMTPDMLRQTEHPARQLVNRMGTAAAGLDPGTAAGKGVEQEITRIVDRVLNEFRDDISIFSDCLVDLERYLVEELPQVDAKVSSSARVLEEVDQSDAPVLPPLVMPDWLINFRIDKRVVEFIVRTWLRVVEIETMQREEDDDHMGVYRELLPDLVWSAQEKRSNEERTALMEMLPRLVRSLKSGMSLLQLPENEAREALDQLVPVHTQLLRPNLAVGKFDQFSLSEMRKHFSLLTIGLETEPPRTADTEKFEAELAKQHVEVELDLEREESPSYESDADWLTHMKIGTCVERWSDSGYQLARLSWISKRKTLYMFMLEEKTLPVVYSAVSLIKALREGSVCMLESAPIFERAVETLLSGARSLEEGS
ncbi:MAG TPA: DUF1631 family protein [Burkholderiaceae bacterium]